MAKADTEFFDLLIDCFDIIKNFHYQNISGNISVNGIDLNELEGKIKKIQTYRKKYIDLFNDLETRMPNIIKSIND